jgi:hypothetical protein
MPKCILCPCTSTHQTTSHSWLIFYLRRVILVNESTGYTEHIQSIHPIAHFIFPCSLMKRPVLVIPTLKNMNLIGCHQIAEGSCISCSQLTHDKHEIHTWAGCWLPDDNYVSQARLVNRLTNH